MDDKIVEGDGKKGQSNYEIGRNPNLPGLTQLEADKLIKEHLEKNREKQKEE